VAVVRPSVPIPSDTDQHGRTLTPVDTRQNQYGPVFSGTAEHARADNFVVS
jgi:hypothetical protein